MTPSRRRPPALLFAAAALLSAGCGATTAEVAMHEGILAHRAGEVPKAKGAYERALKRTPTTPGANNNLALLALAEGRLTAAVGLLERELERNPEMWHARLNRALVLVRLGRFKEALADAEPFAALTGATEATAEATLERQRRARILVGLARMGEGGDPAKAADAVRKVAEQPDPGDGLSRLANRILGLEALRAGDMEGSVTHLEAAGDAADPVMLATLLVKLRRQEQALTLIDQRLDPVHRAAPRVRLLVAHAHASAGRPDQASAALAALLDPTAATAVPAAVLSAARRLQASLAAAQGRWADALAALDLAIAAVDQPAPDLWLDRAVALARVGQLDEARRAIAGVLRDHPGYGRATKLEAMLTP